MHKLQNTLKYILCINCTNTNAVTTMMIGVVNWKCCDLAADLLEKSLIFYSNYLLNRTYNAMITNNPLYVKIIYLNL